MNDDVAIYNNLGKKLLLSICPYILLYCFINIVIHMYIILTLFLELANFSFCSFAESAIALFWFIKLTQ